MPSTTVSAKSEFQAFRSDWHKWVPAATAALNRAAEKEFEDTEFRFSKLFGSRCLVGDLIAIVHQLGVTLTDEEVRVIGSMLSAIDSSTYFEVPQPWAHYLQPKTADLSQWQSF